MIKTIKAKITVAVSLMIVILCIVNLAIGIVVSNKGLLDNVEKDLGSAIEIAHIAVSNIIQSQKDKANTVVSNLNTETADYIESLSEAEQYMKEYGWEGIGIVDKQGIVHSRDNGLNALNLSSEEYYVSAKSGKTVISTTVFNKNNELKMFILAPIKNGDVFVASMDCMTLSNMIGDIRIGETGNIFVLDGNGIMIANMRAEMVQSRGDYIAKGQAEKEYESMGRVFNRMKSQEKDVDVYSLNGVERLISFMPIDDTDNWSIGAVAPKKEMTSSIKIIVATMLASSAVIFICGILFTLAFAKKIGDPIKICADRLEKLAEGDLSTPVEKVKSKDETGLLSLATTKIVDSLKTIINDIGYLTNEMSNGNFDINSSCEEKYIGEYRQILLSIRKTTINLNSTLLQINATSNEVNCGADQVSSAAQALSQGATEQAASIEELSATIGEIARQISDNANNAKIASEISLETGRGVMESNQKMQEMLTAMNDISNTSNEISKIIKTIDDIAFQTNILALNAAVEAARAGSAGKGFAVVADEVRSLAGKSAQAAKNTTELIEGSLVAISNGTSIADATANSLLEVVEKTNLVNENIQKISLASEEQAEAVSQVEQGIEQISTVVQTNSATAQESAATSEELSGQANMLSELVGKFKLHDVNNDMLLDIQDETNYQNN